MMISTFILSAALFLPTAQAVTAASSEALEEAAQPYLEEYKDALLDYRLAIPAEAIAEPDLAAQIKTQSAVAKARSIEGAQDEKEYRDEEGYPFNGYMLKTEVVVRGASDRLLSLEQQIATYMGGAHGNYSSLGLIWDKAADEEVSLPALFANGDLEALSRDAWCDGLDAARLEKFPDFYTDAPRDRELTCPKISELAVMPVDANENGRFEALRFHADPYVAGAYAEGHYEVDIAINEALLAALDDVYRASFELAAQ